MSEYVLSCGSAIDLDPALCQEKGINYICFNYEIGGKQYKDDLGVSLGYHDLYELMRQGQKTKTSQVNAQQYEEYFTKLLSQGKDILHIELSGKLTSTMNSAMIALDNLKEKYPNNKIVLVDSYGATTGYGLLMLKAAQKKAEGLTIDQLARWVQENRTCVHYHFCSTDLSTYVAGGRISAAEGFIGQALGICPIIALNSEGKLYVGEKIRTRKKALKHIVELMKENIDENYDYSNPFYLTHSDCQEEAQMLKEYIIEEFPQLKDSIVFGYIGATIGCHTGPGTCGVTYWGKNGNGKND